MGTNTDFTLQELLQAALGGPFLSNINIKILRCVIDNILNKLEAREEIVTTTGYHSSYLKGLLYNSNASALTGSLRPEQTVTTKMQRVNQLEERCTALQKMYEKHLEEMHNCSAELANPWGDVPWEKFAEICENICRIPMPEYIIACKLVKNSLFLRRLKYLVADPLRDRIHKLIDTTAALHTKMKSDSNNAQKIIEKCGVIDDCIMQLETLRRKMDLEDQRFQNTMQEIQDLLNGKLALLEVKAMKIYVKKEYEKFLQLAAEVKTNAENKKCMQIEGEGFCLSCGKSLTEPEIPKPKPVEKPKEIMQKLKDRCPPSLSSQIICKTLKERQDVVDCIKMIEIEEASKLVDPPLFCKTDVTVFEGNDGRFYRKG